MKVVEVATVFGLDGSTLGLRLTCGNVSILFEGLTEEDERGGRDEVLSRLR